MTHEMRKLMEAITPLTEYIDQNANDWGPPDDYWDDGPSPEDEWKSMETLSNVYKNDGWYESLFVTPRGDYWFPEGHPMNGYPVEGGHAEFDKLFNDYMGNQGGRSWEDYRYFPSDQDKVTKGGPDPRKYGIDPDSNENTNTEGLKKYTDDFVAWFKSLLKNEIVWHKEDFMNGQSSGGYDEPDEYEPDEQDYLDASSDWQNSRGY